MKKQICIELTDVAFGVKLEQTGVDLFTVHYGKQVKSGLTYAVAAREFGVCIMHALACDGKLDNRVKGEK